MFEGELIDDLRGADALYAEWDALAVANGMPAMAPAWILAWWKHFAPPSALPRIVAVRDGKRLVGVAPFFVDPAAQARVDYRLPGIDFVVRLSPLAKPGREWGVAETVASLLADADPRPDLIALEGLPVASHWWSALRETWPGIVRPPSRWYSTMACPTVRLEGLTYDNWLSTKSAHFRERMRKTRRRFEVAGGTGRFSSQESLRDDIGTLLRLHATRWPKSPLALANARATAMLEDAGARLLGEGRFRLMVLEMDGQPVDAHLAVAAGGELVGANGGWDERWSEFSPTAVHLLYLIEDSIKRGDRRINLGPGDQAYKRRFANGNDPVGWAILMPPGPHLPLTALRTAPMLGFYATKRAAMRVLSDGQIDRLRAVRSRAHTHRRQGDAGS